MVLTYKIPYNNKTVKIEEFLFKDLRNFILYENNYENEIDILNKLFKTDNLNLIEKITSLLFLRKVCVGEEVSVRAGDKHINVFIDVLLEKLLDIPDIAETIIIDNIILELDYPHLFISDAKDILFSVIKSIQIDEEKIFLHSLTKDDFDTIISKLPPSILNHSTEYIKRNIKNFNLTLLSGKKHLKLQDISISLLNQSAGNFCTYLFKTMRETDFRDIVFVLCKRMSDINFILNSTPHEVDDYIRLYRDEMVKENENLQKETIS